MIRRSRFPSRVLVVEDSDESRDAMLRALECFGHEMLENERGRHFDPMILDVFLEHRSEIEGIQRAEIKDKGSSTGIRLL